MLPWGVSMLPQVAEVARDTTTIRSLDWDRDRFDMCVITQLLYS